MIRRSRSAFFFAACLIAACSSDDAPPSPGSGGSTATGGSAGAAHGGSSPGGSSTGGSATGGSGVGGQSQGGDAGVGGLAGQGQGGVTPDAGGDGDTPKTACNAASPCVYVTATGAGTKDGSDWANAKAGLPDSGTHPYIEVQRAVLQRGTTYLVADGTYPGYEFDEAGGGTETISIKKATVADHGTEVGWTSDLGDGEAVFQAPGTVWVFAPSTKHYLLDGQVGEGKNPGGYGFRLYSTANRDAGTYMVNIDTSGTYEDVGDVFDITIAHTEFDWNNGTAAGPCGFSAGIQIHGAKPNGKWTIANNFIHHASGGAAYVRNGSDYVFEGNYIYLMGDETASGACPGKPDHGHWETFWITIDKAFTLRNNVFEDAYGVGQTGWVMMEATDVDVTGNLFFCSTPDICAVGGNGIIGAWSASSNTNVLIEKNTFKDLFNGAHYLFENVTNLVIRDNIYDNAPGLADNQ